MDKKERTNYSMPIQPPLADDCNMKMPVADLKKQHSNDLILIHQNKTNIN